MLFDSKNFKWHQASCVKNVQGNNALLLTERKMWRALCEAIQIGIAGFEIFKKKEVFKLKKERSKFRRF